MYTLTTHNLPDGSTSCMCLCTGEDEKNGCSSCGNPFRRRQMVTAHYQNGTHQATLCWRCEQKRLTLRLGIGQQHD